MTRKLAFLISGVFLTVCASAIFSSLPLEIAKLDIGIPFIIYGIFFLTPAEGLLAAVLFGFTREILSSAPAGSTLFACIAVALSCIFLKSRLYIESRYTFALVCAIAVLTESFIFLALSVLAKGETKDFYNVLVFAVPDAIETGFLGLFMFILFERAKIRYMGRV
jgi:cell shape-determining protein MreD